MEFRSHAMRHTMATSLAPLGGIVGVYQRHEFSAEKAEALQRWALHVDGLTGGKATNIVGLPMRRR